MENVLEWARSVFMITFDLGGHSLKATAVISEIHKVLHIEVPLKEIFMNPTIKELSRFIETSAEDPYEKIEPCMESEFYETSSAQKRMYTFQQVEKRALPIICRESLNSREKYIMIN